MRRAHRTIRRAERRGRKQIWLLDGPGRGLGERDDFGEGILVAPLPAGNEFFLEVAQVSNGSAEGDAA